jgi:hypothetical protein
MWNCYTEGKYGQSIRDAPAVAKPFEKNLYNCLFREGTGMDLMGAMVITSDMARDLNKGDPSPLHQRRFTDIKIGDYL